MVQALLSPQRLLEIVDDREERLLLPNARREVIGGVPWGAAEACFTPAYWATQYWYATLHGGYMNHQWTITGNLRDELVACLLGGFGITYEMNRAAFQQLQGSGMLDEEHLSEDEIIELLTTPMVVGHRRVKYRFPRQKGRFVYAALNAIKNESPSTDCPKELRQWLLKLPGVGIKTASWITRNVIAGAPLAVIDVHVFRAGVIMGLFRGNEKLPRDYEKMEGRFVDFARALGADIARLDVLMWCQMRESGAIAIQHFLRAS